jgi:hypothetical protein
MYKIIFVEPVTVSKRLYAQGSELTTDNGRLVLFPTYDRAFARKCKEHRWNLIPMSSMKIVVSKYL